MKKPRFVVILKDYQAVIAIFSAFLVAGSFMSSSKDPSISGAGYLFFVAGFFGIVWCIVDALTTYTTLQLIKTILKYFSGILISVVISVIILTFIGLIASTFLPLLKGTITSMSPLAQAFSLFWIFLITILVSFLVTIFIIYFYIKPAWTFIVMYFRSKSLRERVNKIFMKIRR